MGATALNSDVDVWLLPVVTVMAAVAGYFGSRLRAVATIEVAQEESEVELGETAAGTAEWLTARLREEIDRVAAQEVRCALRVEQLSTEFAEVRVELLDLREDNRDLRKQIAALQTEGET